MAGKERRSKMSTEHNSDNEHTDTEEVEQLTEQEYQWCRDHLDEAARRLDRVAEIVEGTEAATGRNDKDLNDARARAKSYRVYLDHQITPEGEQDE